MVTLKGFPASNSISMGIVFKTTPMVYDPFYKPPKKFFKKVLNSILSYSEKKAEVEASQLQIKKDIEKIAYFKWIDAGRPEGRSEEFWNQAVEQYYYADHDDYYDMSAASLYQVEMR